MTDFQSCPPHRFTTMQCVIAGILAEIIGFPAALYLAFVGLITYSGCFIECETAQANPGGAIAAFTASALLAPAGFWIAGLMARSRGLLTSALVLSCLGPLFVIFVVLT